MLTICAWCRKSLGSEPPDGSPVSHGICASCAELVLMEKRTLGDFLDTLSAPVLAIDGQGKAITASATALAALGKDIAQVEGQLGGDVMECVHASLPEGCGKTIHCTGCQIRTNVARTRDTGIPVVGAPAFMTIVTPAGSRKLDYFISTELLPTGVVLLRIDAVKTRRPGG